MKGILLSTLVTLVSAGVGVAAQGTLALDEAVCQEGRVGLDGAEGLDGLALLNVAILPELAEDVPDDLGLPLGGSAAEDVEGDVKVVVDALVDDVVLQEGATCRSISEAKHRPTPTSGHQTCGRCGRQSSTRWRWEDWIQHGAKPRE